MNQDAQQTNGDAPAAATRMPMDRDGDGRPDAAMHDGPAGGGASQWGMPMQPGDGQGPAWQMPMQPGAGGEQGQMPMQPGGAQGPALQMPMQPGAGQGPGWQMPMHSGSAGPDATLQMPVAMHGALDTDDGLGSAGAAAVFIALVLAAALAWTLIRARMTRPGGPPGSAGAATGGGTA